MEDKKIANNFRRGIPPRNYSTQIPRLLNNL